MRRAEKSDVVAAGRGLIEIHSAYGVTRTVEYALELAIIVADRLPSTVAKVEVCRQLSARLHIHRLPVRADDDIAEGL